MKVAVLFDGAGLARLGLEQAGHECIGVELNPNKHYLSKMVGSGNCILGDATKFDLSEVDGVWTSSPCQERSQAKLAGEVKSKKYAKNEHDYCLSLIDKYPNLKVIWIENVKMFKKEDNSWGTLYNAAQFLEKPIQCRNRVIGGKYEAPKVYREYRLWYPDFDLCPAITASEYQGHANDWRRASRYYGRKLRISECAFHQGFSVPEEWLDVPDMINEDTGKYHNVTSWSKEIYEAIGNGVPVYMAKAFGEMYK